MENSWSLTEESALFAPVLDIAGTRELEKIYLQSDGYGLMQYAAGCIFSRICFKKVIFYVGTFI